MLTGRSSYLCRKIMLSLLVSSFMFAASEVILRTVVRPKPNIIFQSLESHIGQGRLSSFTKLIEEDAELFWRLAPNRSLPETNLYFRGLISNAAGLREDHEIPFEKPVGQIRILFLGDSCTFGFGWLHMESFVEIAERLLQQRYPSIDVECINAGVPGYTLMQGWRQMLRTGMSYHPDLVVATFGWNDARTWTTRSDLQQFYAKQKATPPGLLARSELCHHLWRVMHRLRNPPGSADPVPRVSLQEYEELLRRMRDLAVENQVEFLPMVWPVKVNFPEGGALPLGDYQKIVYRLGQSDFVFGSRQEPGFIDPLPAMAEAVQQRHISKLFIDGVHTRLPANTLIAEVIVRKIEEWYVAMNSP